MSRKSGYVILVCMLLFSFILPAQVKHTALQDSIQILRKELEKQKKLCNEKDAYYEQMILAKDQSIQTLTENMADTQKALRKLREHSTLDDREIEKLLKHDEDDERRIRLMKEHDEQDDDSMRKMVAEDLMDDDSIRNLAADLKEHDSIIVKEEAEHAYLSGVIERNKKLLMIMGVMLLLSVLLGFSIYNNYRNKKRANLLLQEKNEEIMQQNEEIRAQRDEIERHMNIVTEQRNHIAQQNKEITDSIIYARRIQTALLPHKDTIKSDIAESFILFMPRNIVSGDYYWMSRKEKKAIVVAADCTGHGVPGAFMSMLGMAFLNDIISKYEIFYANEILNELREYVISALKQRGAEEDSKDGMDMAICIIDFETMVMQYAGAYNPIYHIHNGDLKEISADKMPVSFYVKGQLAFTNNLIPIEEGDCFYMLSDGYCDQFGGPNDKKFTYKRFRDLLLSVHQKPMYEQHRLLEKTLNDWKGEHEQTDDILVIGIRV